MTVTTPASRILVQCPSWVGDAVMATPALRCLRRNYPQAQITWLLRPYVRAVLADTAWCDDIVEYAPYTRETPGLLATGLALRRRHFDLAVLLTHSLRSALLARLSGATHRVGMTRGDRAFLPSLLTDPILWPRDHGRRRIIAKVDLYAAICRQLGCDGWDDRRQELFFALTQDQRVVDLLTRKEVRPDVPLICLVPGAAYGESKRWYADRFALVGDALARRYGAQVVLIAAPSEGSLAAEITGAMRQPAVVLAASEMDLGRLKPLVARSSLMIATDTGPRHYAVAFNVPVVVLMGATDPRLTASPYERTTILRHDVECGPCQKRRCATDHRCMKLITVDEVLAAAADLVARWPPHPWTEAPQAKA